MNEAFAEITKPTILVSNHPNTLFDAINAAAAVSTQAKFLANYSLFKSRFGNWFFNTFYCIPVQRPEDIVGGKTDNDKSMAKSHEFLANGGTLYIAAEAYSIQTLGIRPLKTGAARLALGTEEDIDWNADLQILPLGLNYDEADRFRSNLVIHIGKPYSVKKWRQEYQKEPKETVRKVTQELEDNMRSLLLDGDDAVIQLLKAIRSYWGFVQPADPKREYLRARKLLFQLKTLNVETIDDLSSDISQFEENCKTNKLSGKEVAAAMHDQQSPIKIGNLIAALPITVIGVIANIIPYVLCHAIEKKANDALVYRSTFRILTGVIFFPLMYLFWMWCISYYTNNVILTLLSILVYRRAGIFAWHQIQDWKRYFKSRNIITKEAHHIAQLRTILSSIDQLVR